MFLFLFCLPHSLHCEAGSAATLPLAAGLVTAFAAVVSDLDLSENFPHPHHSIVRLKPANAGRFQYLNASFCYSPSPPPHYGGLYPNHPGSIRPPTFQKPNMGKAFSSGFQDIPRVHETGQRKMVNFRSSSRREARLMAGHRATSDCFVEIPTSIACVLPRWLKCTVFLAISNHSLNFRNSVKMGY